MYLVTMQSSNGPRLLFFHADPRLHGCPYPVVEGVVFEERQIQNDEWSLEGGPKPHIVAQQKRTPNRYRAFRSELDVPNGWEILDGQAEVWVTWEAFQRRRCRRF